MKSARTRLGRSARAGGRARFARRIGSIARDVNAGSVDHVKCDACQGTGWVLAVSVSRDSPTGQAMEAHA